MFKYIRTINTCSGNVETTNLPMPAAGSGPCSAGTICYLSGGRLSNMPSESGVKYLVLSRPNEKGEQTCLRIMSGMIIEAETYFDISECNIGDGASFSFSDANITDTVELGGTECEIIEKNATGTVTVIVN